MSHRRELARRRSALDDIAGILTAMKHLALMETHLLRDFLASQRLLVAGIETALADLLAWFPELTPPVPADQGCALCVLVGSEQGFCGDYNERIIARLEVPADPVVASRWIIVGQRLAARLDEDPRATLRLSGASVVDEVPAVLLRLTGELNHLLAQRELRGGGLAVLYQDDVSGEPQVRHLLPLRVLTPAGPHYSHAPALNLPPAQVLAGITRHFLHAVLNEVLFSALMAENRQRQAHMDRALQRLDQDRDRLRRAYNAQRQEEITEEIEILLLSSDRLAESSGPSPASMGKAAIADDPVKRIAIQPENQTPWFAAHSVAQAADSLTPSTRVGEGQGEGA